MPIWRLIMDTRFPHFAQELRTKMKKTQKKMVLLTLLGLALLLALAACSPGAPPVASEPTNTPVPEPTLAPTEAAPAAEGEGSEEETTAPPIAGIQDTVWQWADLVETQPASQSVVPNPENYAIVFASDGTAHIQADCNMVKGTYTEEGDQLTIELGPSTMAFCGDESLDQQFLGLLITVGSYALEDGWLKLNLIEGAGSMGFANGGMSEMAEAAEAPAPEETSPQADIIGMVWEWEAYQDNGEVNDITVPDPSLYTLLLNPDGTYNIKADCNTGSGSYTLEGSSISFGPGPMTMAMCEPDSLDQTYLRNLGDVVTFVLTDEAKLALNLKMDAGNMIFRQAGAVTPETPEASSSSLDPSLISLNTQGLPYSWQAVVVPEQPYDVSQPPGPMGLPEHFEILFGVTDPADRQPGDPIMYIIPAAAYQQLWGANGNLAVARTMTSIDQLAYVLPAPPETSGYPALPYEETGAGVNDLATQVGRATSTDTSASKSGYRLVGRWAQDANPVSNQGLRYVYQGFTNDGKYLVSFWYPVSTSQLPESAGEVSQEDLDAFNSDTQAYMTSKAEMLNSLPTSDWGPDLAILDDLVGSLQIDGMATSGLIGPEWHWLGTLDGEGAIKREVADPSSYVLSFNTDGTYQFKADCNSGSGSFSSDGGMTGSVKMEAGATTLAECGPDSHANDLVNMMVAVQDYRLRGRWRPHGLDLAGRWRHRCFPGHREDDRVIKRCETRTLNFNQNREQRCWMIQWRCSIPVSSQLHN